MLFSSLSYLFFFPLVFLAYWISSGATRKAILLVASYFFYMSWMPIYGILILSLTVVNFFLGKLIERDRKNTFLFVLGLAINLGTLAYYKYAGFFLSSALSLVREFARFLPDISMPPESVALNIILPLGISFFTFEFIHYLVDVRKGSPALRNPLDFGLFAAFFPSQLAGPIKRYQQFNEQLNRKKTFNVSDISSGFALIAQGLFKKVALADNLAPISAAGFSNVHNLATSDAWVLMFAFSLQIYFDFSGYTDMGIGSARMLGFHLPSNFNIPYLISCNFVDFWRNWHISLSSWLRDYLFIPLGGSRNGRFNTYRNLMITCTLSGLWHGAGWHFVAWGVLNGCLIIATHEQQRLVAKSPLLTKIHAHPLSIPVAVASNFVCLMFSWSLFAAGSIGNAMVVMQHMLGGFAGSLRLAKTFVDSPVMVALIAYAVYGLIFVDVPWLPLRRLKAVRKYFLDQPPLRYAFCICVFIAAIGFSPDNAVPFIYFQF